MHNRDAAQLRITFSLQLQAHNQTRNSQASIKADALTLAALWSPSSLYWLLPLLLLVVLPLPLLLVGLILVPELELLLPELLASTTPGLEVLLLVLLPTPLPPLPLLLDLAVAAAVAAGAATGEGLVMVAVALLLPLALAATKPLAPGLTCRGRPRRLLLLLGPKLLP